MPWRRQVFGGDPSLGGDRDHFRRRQEPWMNLRGGQGCLGGGNDNLGGDQDSIHFLKETIVLIFLRGDLSQPMRRQHHLGGDKNLSRRRKKP
ncbi:hypothetical protein DCAR_0934512 [Daucus carota subsp. sativus]|uniref:Uncharacterized protein n=1 Tax=Daucus carota subsp. sativus TaxID=79200 RepID=A0A175YA91_DAUCS|nr:hypothetical protein DCAR_0934512 [Daucus carota subsp. sativus]